MSTTPIDNTEDIIDSRDVIARVEELEDTFRDLLEQVQAQGWTIYQTNGDQWNAVRENDTGPDAPHHVFDHDVEAIAFAAQQSGVDVDVDEVSELYTLRALVEQCEGYGDWGHGETLIRESYFVEYIEELIDDCYSLPKELTSGNWPYRHITIDYEAAAEEAKVDYTEVVFDGETYFLRA
ncbi:hypothetical protein ACPPTR_09010 [Ralstonia pseudosolanacearum]|uniref:hypothetical protein n=1 Tax=Ralstonia pseudosolanacearum TaxID=1310165 RepID=UPI0018D08969|nr:hypothetical protein [Ralstonia pseudosolanacearum]MCD9228627.1 hypothetical protein [Ralstonia pseudosolanacearum]